MDLTDEHLELCFLARVAANTGGGVALQDPGLIPIAHDLDRAGWLSHRVIDGHVTWYWTEAGETALALGGLLHSADGRMN